MFIIIIIMIIMFIIIIVMIITITTIIITGRLLFDYHKQILTITSRQCLRQRVLALPRLAAQCQISLVAWAAISVFQF